MWNCWNCVFQTGVSVQFYRYSPSGSNQLSYLIICYFVRFGCSETFESVFLFHHLLLSGSGFPKHGKYDFSMLSLARTSGREAGITANPSCDPWGPSCILVGILMECYTILFSKTFKRKWMSTFKHQKYKHVPTAFKRWWFFRKPLHENEWVRLNTKMQICSNSV